MSKRRVSLDELLEFANQVRKAGNGEPINKLKPGIPEEPTSCLIAVNLNFNCSVTTLDNDRWIMVVDDKSLRDNIAKAMRLRSVSSRVMYANVLDGFGIYLPATIGRCAEAFDRVGTFNPLCQRLSRADTRDMKDFMPYIADSEEEAS